MSKPPANDSQPSPLEEKLEKKINAFMSTPFSEDKTDNSSILTPKENSGQQKSSNSTRFETPKANKERDDPWARPLTPKNPNQVKNILPPKQSTPYPQLNINSRTTQTCEEPKDYRPLTEISNFKVYNPNNNQEKPVVQPPSTPRDKKTLRLEALRLHNISGISDPEFDELIAEFADERRRCIYHHNFQDSKHLTEVINNLCQCQVKQRKENLQKEAIKQYEAQLKRFEEDLHAFDAETTKLIRENKDKFNNQMMQVSAQHVVEQKELETKWTSKSKIKQYAHASQELIAMRKQFKQDIIAERFDDAQRLQKELLVIEERDKKNAFAAMQHDFDVATEQLQKKQDSEIRQINDSLKSSEEQIVTKREKLRNAFVLRARKIAQQREIVKDADKVWNQMEMQRREQLAKGSAVRTSTASRRIRMSDIEKTEKLFHNQSEEITLVLPPINFSKSPKTPRTPKTTRPRIASTRTPGRYSRRYY